MKIDGLTTLNKRSEFLAAARGQRIPTPGFILQVRKRPKGEIDGTRIGFTCSKKVGNAVMRNRAKRRLREIARQVLPAHGRQDYDYVLVGRKDTTVARDFGTMSEDLMRALKKAHP